MGAVSHRTLPAAIGRFRRCGCRFPIGAKLVSEFAGRSAIAGTSGRARIFGADGDVRHRLDGRQCDFVAPFSRRFGEQKAGYPWSQRGDGGAAGVVSAGAVDQDAICFGISERDHFAVKSELTTETRRHGEEFSELISPCLRVSVSPWFDGRLNGSERGIADCRKIPPRAALAGGGGDFNDGIGLCGIAAGAVVWAALVDVCDRRRSGWAEHHYTSSGKTAAEQSAGIFHRQRRDDFFVLVGGFAGSQFAAARDRAGGFAAIGGDAVDLQRGDFCAVVLALGCRWAVCAAASGGS